MKQIDQLIDWNLIEKAIAEHYSPISDAAGRPAYSGLLLFKMLLVGIWNGGLSDESVEDMANSNLHVMRFLGLSLEDDVPDHSVLSRFRTRLTVAQAWDGLLTQINQQIAVHAIAVKKVAVMLLRALHKFRVNLKPSQLMKWSAIGKNGMMNRIPNGAGDGGEMVLRELNNNPEWQYIAVGFVNDDPLKTNKLMHGLKVYDGKLSLVDICVEKEISEVLISARDIGPERMKEIREACREANVTLKRAVIKIEPVDFG